MLHELLVAFCLLLVLEGILPFLAPSRWRKMLLTVSQFSDRGIRVAGLTSMLIGVLLLYWIN